MRTKRDDNSIYKGRVRIDLEALDVLKIVQKLNNKKGEKYLLAEIASETIKKYAKNFKRIVGGKR